MASTSVSSEPTGLLKGRCQFEVFYEDTDLSGFVYHANYLKFFERAREKIIGVSYLQQLYEQGLHFVVSKAELTFKAPLRHADLVVVKSEGAWSRSPAITFEQRAFRAAGEVLAPVATGIITIVALNKDHRPVRMPDDVMEYFKTRELRGTKNDQF